MKGIIRRRRADGTMVYVARPRMGSSRRSLGTFATIEEAEDAIIAERDRFRVHKGEDLAITEAVDLFKGQRGGHLAASSRNNYWRALDRFAADFGHRPIQKLAFVELQAWANGVPGSYLRTVRTLYQWLIQAGIVATNPTAGVIPRPVERSHRPKILTAAQVEALADCAFEEHPGPEAPYVAAHIRFAAYSGMRPGEIAALTWECINFAKQEIEVRGSVDITGDVKLPKNGKQRTIVLTDAAADALQMLPVGMPTQRVFELPEGSTLVKATLNRYFDPVRRKAGLPGYRFYDLRHTCATLLLEAGMPSYVVAIQLGHQDGGRLVETTYGHPSTQAALDRIKQVSLVTGAKPKALRAVNGGPQNGGDAA